MKDYSFGNFICELRSRHRLSQFQLGMLVGVSDKAVSKWENGTSKPKLPTCRRLAEVFGITLDELLVCKYHDPSQDKNGVFAMKKLIWDNIEKQMHVLYGNKVPARIAARYESEKRLIDRGDLIIHLGALAKISTQARDSGIYMWYLGDINSSFIAWLMGITSINPLEPHYYCKECKHIEFISDAKDGYDLQPKYCSCGKAMICDGHRIPFENTIYHLETVKTFEAAISAEMLQESISILTEYYSDIAKVARIEINGDMFGNTAYYVLINKDETSPKHTIEPKEYFDRYRNHIKFIFIAHDNVEFINKLCRLTNRIPSMIDIQYNDIIPVHQQMMISKKYDIREKQYKSVLESIQPHCFSEMLMTEGLLRSTGAWENNQQPLYENGNIKLANMLIFREDIYDMISSSLKDFTNSGTGLEMRIMENVYKGRYALYGMPDNERQLLRDIGINDMYIEIMTNIFYMFPKAHCIASLKADLLLTWFMINHRDIYGRLATDRQ